MKVAVVGGGITGLAAAWYLRDRADVVLYEADARLGGKIRTGTLAGHTIEEGPDAFLARVHHAAALCREVGLGDELVGPATGRAYVWTGGRLRPFPSGLVLGVPSDLAAVVRSGVLSPVGVVRAGLDLVLPRSPAGRHGDAAVGELARARFGAEVAERLVDPMLGGIHAGPADRLSAAAVAPQLLDAARSHRSLLRGLGGVGFWRKPPESNATPVFLTVEGGLNRLVNRLAASVPDIRLGAPVTSIETDGAGYRVDGERVDAAIVTTPAFAAADLLRAMSPGTAAGLAAIEYASVVVTLLAYPRSAPRRPLDGSGFLVPRRDGRLMTACTWASSKWAHLADPETVLLRVSAGRWGDERAQQLDDDALVDALHAELASAIGMTAPPSASRVVRWPRSLPQQTVGHLERVAALDAALTRDAPGVVLAGAAYRGLGLPACIAQAHDATQRVTTSVTR